MEHLELTTVETAKDLGLLPEEFERIKEILGRVPNFTELSIFAVMWSEHCSYKNSITWLKTLPKDSPRMLAKAGEENAGLVDLGDGIGCAFKIESHNHPSALEPYQGAATGVGGINRDIFTMGARPIAQLNSLRFGDLTLDKTKWLVKGVVKGISHYGNAFGIPTVGGELFFDDCYNVNPLVNAMSAGIVKAGETVSATSYGVGNPVYIVGSATGKDGIHGAAFASKDITADSVNDLPAVQVGDPFQEKLLLEATLEVIKTGAVVGMQDMGAAGIICSNSEMSAKGEHGMRIDLDKVPTRQPNMKPYEILLSESQERMLIVVYKGREKEVEAVFDKWDLNCAIIGEVTDTQRLEYYMHGEKVADVPADDLVLGGGAPVYQREYREPAYYAENQKFNINDVPEPANLVEVAEHLAAHPNLASKRWVTDQYDSMVGVQTMTANLACDAAVVAVKDTDKAIVLTTDCNSRYVYADPYKGTAIAVAEAARNITCAGGEPVAITNCLNFGNPYNPEVYWQFVSAIKGMGDACRKFETPVTGGNVSFYNQSADGGSVFPTPTIGMLGVMDNVDNIMTADFKQPGDSIYLIGESVNDIASSQYLASWHKILKAPAPYFDIDKEYDMQQTIKGLIKHRVIESAHDVADGGLYIALLEAAMPNGLGFDIETDDTIRKDAFLFGEAQGRVIVTVAPEEQERFIEFMATSEVEFSLLGTVNNGFLNVDQELFGHVTDLKMVHSNVLHTILGE
ncbi:phosphoribosylformylglycinamidine synthase subunit PurL [Mucilaginibacter pocheonensis]|uniref:Phosphoribosylformylglycinamidine synthase subunit PurL n=1 Tax=Mucilaginibacter pocheonensis TaxID=398050 RepID=A0ABU1T7H0_9SPHI|nr:phosphoribosylformylglycinamidine synthase subunit PurL [Mucilaginibacter pocheonensis]MDR6940831.1 phosphoribosylformylglycinamidine synthase [Mucilaginibacter pocheonensis]